LATVTDDEIWTRARAEGFAIVTKDEDFNDIAVVRGPPPKVLWLQLGNCTTDQIEATLRTHFVEIEAFEADDSAATFVMR
jgi:predicted nuclease of predicted toxin-antitoxin system